MTEIATSPAAPVTPAAPPLGPTSPDAAPSQSREVQIQTQIDALYAKSQQEPNQQKRMALNDQRLALEREKLGPANTVHTVIGAAPGESLPEQEPLAPYFDPGPARAGVTRDAQVVEEFSAIGRTYEIPTADIKIAHEQYEAAQARPGDHWDETLSLVAPRWDQTSETRMERLLDKAAWGLDHVPATLRKKLDPLAQQGHPRVLLGLAAFYDWRHRQP